MTRSFLYFLCTFVLVTTTVVFAQSHSGNKPPVMLPTSKMLTVPSPGRIGSTNSFPATMVLSPDGRYAALLNDGYGTQETLAHQSISVLDLKTNQIIDYPDARLERRSASELFPRAGVQFGRQASVRLGGFADRSDRRETRQHGKRHRGLPLF